MRAIEVWLSLVNILALIRWVVSPLRAAPWTGYVAPIALLVAIVQVLIEGPRWEMFPAYGLAILFFLIWLAGVLAPHGVQVRRFVSVPGVAAGILILVISIALPIVLPVFHFPKPTGPYAIGTLTYHWIDTSRLELFGTPPNQHRQLIAQVWYPAVNEPSVPRAPYIEDASAVTPAIGQLFNLPSFVFSHLKYVTTHAALAAPMADGRASYPVLIYLTGVDGFRGVSGFQIEDLVSHGYIVVGLDQPGISAVTQLPDGQEILGWPRDRIQPLINQSVVPQPDAPTIDGKPLPDGIIPYFAQDASFALDQLTELNKSDPNHILTGRLDLARVGTFGISLGGMDAAAACLKDPRLKACLIMDVWMPADVVKTGLKQPTMFMTRDAASMRLEHVRAGGWSAQDIALTLDTMRAVYDSLPGNGYFLQIPNMFHVNFTDLPYWSPILSQLGVTGPIDAQWGFDIVNAYTVAFFNQALNGEPSQLLKGPSKQYPDVIFEARRP